MTYILATANPGKIKEMRDILSKFGINIVTRDDMGITIEVEETGTTFIENAALKAKAICDISKMPAIADDSGIVVEALNGEPGVYSSSYGGDSLTDEERYNYLLGKMEGIDNRAAKFVSTIVCVFPNGDLITATGECDGSILYEPRGSGGFGYDPVFKPHGFTKSMGELTIEEKNGISHRGRALREFIKKLEDYIG